MKKESLFKSKSIFINKSNTSNEMETMNTTANTAANNQVSQGKRVGGFRGKRHDLATKNKISQTQKARYDYMRQMMKQQQESKEFGPIDIDNPTFAQKIKDIVRELLKEEMRNAIPTYTNRPNIPIY